jgi:MFS family permease
MAAHGHSPSAYAILMGLNCVGVVVLQPVLSPRLRGKDPGVLLAVMALLFGLGYGVNALGGALWTYGLGTTLWTVGEVVGFPAASTLVAEFAPANLRGRYQGAFSMMFGLAMTLGPILGGELLTRGGGRLLWSVCLVVALLVAAGQLLARGPRQRRLMLQGLPPA